MKASNRREFLKKAGLSFILAEESGKKIRESFETKELDNPKEWPQNIQTILENTEKLKYPRNNRLPLYLWPAIDPGEIDIGTAKKLVEILDERGIGIICSWKWQENQRLKSLESALSIATAQKTLGQPVNIDATSLLYSFYDGSEDTAHIDDNGLPFFDDSFGKDHKMGCPFTLGARKEEIKKRIEFFLDEYIKRGLDIDFIYADWEIDGPIAVNGTYKASQRCRRCKANLSLEFTYAKFQKAMMDMRAYLQQYVYGEPVLSRFPNALVGNYGDYPNDGYRYWYDYFEQHQPWQPFKQDQHARYREWYNNFPRTGFTMAMPVVYTWKDIFWWYDFKNKDYRWFYNMLLAGSNGVKNTVPKIPVVSFVHWNTIIIRENSNDSEIVQMSEQSYRELLWHLLLRGTDSFFMWSEKNEFPAEVRLVHEVYASALQYREFLDHGWPVTYEVPLHEGTVISGLSLGDNVLVRRTDFGENKEPISFLVGTKSITIEFNPGVCQIISL